MGDRRMLSKKITSSAKFLKMPLETQALYFHLAQNADDDGVVEGFTIMRVIGSSEDSLKVLEAKQYIKVLNEDLVLFIVDWLEHNSIRPDRKTDSIYKALLINQIPEVQLIETKQRSDRKKMDDRGTSHGQPMDDRGTSHGQPMDGVSKEKLREVKRSKDKIEKEIYEEVVHLKVEEYQKLIEKFGHDETQERIERLALYLKSTGKTNKYKCHYSTILSWARKDEKEKPKQTKDESYNVFTQIAKEEGLL